MYKMLIEESAGIHIWAIVGLILFMAVFLGSVVYSLCLSKQFSKTMAELPLKDSPELEEGQ